MSTAVSLLISPITISFARRKSTRLTAVMGGLVTALGCLFTSFATQFHQLFFSYGAVIGKLVDVYLYDPPPPRGERSGMMAQIQAQFVLILPRRPTCSVVLLFYYSTIVPLKILVQNIKLLRS